MNTSAKTLGNLIGVVLAGGLSSRLGMDKANLILEGEESLLSRATRLLLEVVPEVLVVGRMDAALAGLRGVSCIADDWPGCGPVGGIATALRHSGSDCLVLSCDLPFMTAQTLQKLTEAWSAREPQTLLYAYSQAGTGKIENLAGIYAQAALPILRNTLEKKLLKISMVIPKERIKVLEYSMEEALPFFNINYPADLLLAREYLILKNQTKK